MSTELRPIEPQPEMGPCLRALPNERWRRACTALFISGGNRTEALRLAGFRQNRNALSVSATRMFQDKRMIAAIRECASEIIDGSEPELIATTFQILRDTTTDPKNRLAAARLLWDRARPVTTQHRVAVDVTLSSDQLDVSHYRALTRIGAPQSAFLARFGHNGVERVRAMVALEDKRQAAATGQTIEGSEYHEVTE